MSFSVVLIWEKRCTYHFYLLWWILSRRRDSVGHGQMRPGLIIALATGGFLLASVHIMVAAGLFLSVAEFVYLFGLLWYLAMALVNFVAILLHRLNLD